MLAFIFNSKSWLGLLLFISCTGFAEDLTEKNKTVLDLMSNLSPFHEASLVKENGKYYIWAAGETYFDKDGKILKSEQVNISPFSGSFSQRIIEYYWLIQRVQIPVLVTTEVTSGGGNKFQFGGYGDSDRITGHFSKSSGFHIQDMFTQYQARSINVGLTFAGAGYTRAMSASGIKLSEGNGSIMFIGPTGLPMGINSGLEFVDYQMKVSPDFRSEARVTYTLFYSKEGMPVRQEFREWNPEVTELMSLPLLLKRGQ